MKASLNGKIFQNLGTGRGFGIGPGRKSAGTQSRTLPNQGISYIQERIRTIGLMRGELRRDAFSRQVRGRPRRRFEPSAQSCVEPSSANNEPHISPRRHPLEKSYMGIQASFLVSKRQPLDRHLCIAALAAPTARCPLPYPEHRATVLPLRRNGCPGAGLPANAPRAIRAGHAHPTCDRPAPGAEREVGQGGLREANPMRGIQRGGPDKSCRAPTTRDRATGRPRA